MVSDEAFVTLATNDTYGLGALVLANSLKRTRTSRQLAILITPGVSPSMKSQLSKLYNVVQVVDVLDSQDAANLTLLARPELGITLTKLHAWNLTQFKKAVFLDADCLVIKNVDELFEREELSAVSDVGWPDCFNTGVFVFRPDAQTYANLIKFAADTGSFDGGDQGLLNSYFPDWATKDISRRLPFIYNMVATIIYSYAPAFKQFGHNVKIVHFLGNTKPWHQASASSGAFSPALGNFLQLWWQIYISEVHGGLGMEPGLAGLAGQISQLNLGTDVDHNMHESQSQADTGSHRREWESGNIDYKGADSFSNIERRIQDSIHKGQHGGAKQPSPPPAVSHVKQSSPPPASGHSVSQHSHEPHGKQSSPAPSPAQVAPPTQGKQPSPPPTQHAEQTKQQTPPIEQAGSAKQQTPPPVHAASAPQPSHAQQEKQPTPPSTRQAAPEPQQSVPQGKQPTPPPAAQQPPQGAAQSQTAQGKQPTPPPVSAQQSSAQAKQPSPAPADVQQASQGAAQNQAAQGKQPTPPPATGQQPAKQPSPAPAGAPGSQQVRPPAPQTAPAHPNAPGNVRPAGPPQKK